MVGTPPSLFLKDEVSKKEAKKRKDVWCYMKRESSVKRWYCLFILLSWVWSWFRYFLTMSYSWSDRKFDRKFKLIQSLPPRSLSLVNNVGERWCGSSLLRISKRGEAMLKRWIKYTLKGDQTPLPTMVAY